MSPTSRRVLRWAPIGLALIVLVLVGRLLYQERQQLLSYAWQFRPQYFVLASIGHAISVGVVFIAWHGTLHQMAGVVNPTWRTNLAIYYTTVLARRIPGTVWYAAGRVWMYEQRGVSASITLAALALETAIVFLAGLLFFLLLLPFSLTSQNIATTALGQLPLWTPAPLIALTLGLMWPGVLEWGINLLRRRWGREEIRLRVRYRDLLTWTALTVVGWFAAGLGFYGVVSVLHPLPLSELPVILMIGTLAILFGMVSFVVPVLPVVKETTMVVLLTPYMPLSVAVVVALLYRVWWTLNDVAWAVLGSRWGDKG